MNSDCGERRQARQLSEMCHKKEASQANISSASGTPPTPPPPREVIGHREGTGVARRRGNSICGVWRSLAGGPLGAAEQGSWVIPIWEPRISLCFWG